MKNWTDVYSLPFKPDSEYGWVYDDNDNFIFQFEHPNKQLCKAMLETINGDRVLSGRTDKIMHEKGSIKTEKGTFLILIRGWGNLTGIGTMNLTENEAANIQDTLAEFIVNKLNK